MVCSAQHHLITVFKQQIRGVGRTFHCGEGKGSSASSSPEPQTKLRLSGHNRLATESATTETLLASIYLFLFRIVRLLLMENVGSKMTMAPVYLTARNYRIICRYCEWILKYLLNTELKYTNVNHMANLFLFGFLLSAFFYDNVIAIRCRWSRQTSLSKGFSYYFHDSTTELYFRSTTRQCRCYSKTKTTKYCLKDEGKSHPCHPWQN